MKKAVTLTILGLLVAGVASSIHATSHWTGGAGGRCGAYHVLSDWQGTLNECCNGFDGYWHGKFANIMRGGARETSPGSNIWDIYTGKWNSAGEAQYYHGTWVGRFDENTGTMCGSWDSENIDCITGFINGTKDRTEDKDE